MWPEETDLTEPSKAHTCMYRFLLILSKVSVQIGLLEIKRIILKLSVECLAFVINLIQRFLYAWWVFYMCWCILLPIVYVHVVTAYCHFYMNPSCGRLRIIFVHVVTCLYFLIRTNRSVNPWRKRAFVVMQLKAGFVCFTNCILLVIFISFTITKLVRDLHNSSSSQVTFCAQSIRSTREAAIPLVTVYLFK